MKKGKRTKKTNKLKNIFIVLLSIIFLACITYLSIHHYKAFKNKQLYNELYENIDQEQQDQSSAKTGIMNKIVELQKQNEDVKGWLTIADTNINYPILQAKDNDYYLTHDFKKEKNPYGSIYINSNSKLNEINSNVIIYGHNMKNGQMFSDLTKYIDKSFYDQHNIIKLSTNDTKEDYQIICVFKSKVYNKEEESDFKYYQYTSLENEDIYKEYINNCKAIELYDIGATANYGDQLITLVTCEYSQENGRIVVVAKKVNAENQALSDLTLDRFATNLKTMRNYERPPSQTIDFSILL